jgi:hypothetical protein
MNKTIVNKYTNILAKKELDLSYERCREFILGVISRCKDPKEKRELINVMNQNGDPLIEKRILSMEDLTKGLDGV